MVAGVRQDDPDVGHRRLGEDAGDVALRQRPVERFDIVPLDRLRRFRHVNRRADVVGARAGLAVDLDRERLVDGAVVAPGVDEDLRPAGDRPGEPDHGAVGVGGGQRELPVGEAEAASKLLADPARVLGGEHQGDAADCLGGDRLGRCGGRMPGHRAGIAQAEVDVGVAVHVGEVGARRLGHEHRVRAGPLRHPRHRHAGKERLLPLLKELPGARVLLDEALLLGSQEPAQPLAIHRLRHVASICRLRRRFTGR